MVVLRAFTRLRSTALAAFALGLALAPATFAADL